ncbi:putative eka-like protein, partial [Golovinomyces cichoracearum]
YSPVEYAKVRVRSRLIEKGISIEKIDTYSVKTAVIEEVGKIAEIEMVDAEIDNIIKQGLSGSRWAQSILGKVLNSDFMEVNKKTSQKSIKTLPSSERNSKAGSEQAMSVAAPLKQVEKNTGNRIDGSLSENNISNISDRAADSVKVFEMAKTLRVYLRASIAQFLEVDLGAVPPILPVALILLQNYHKKAKNVSKLSLNLETVTPLNSSDRGTWAMVARKGNVNEKAAQGTV